MKIDIEHDYYAYKQGINRIKQILSRNDSLTICGVFGIGRNRLIKKFVFEENLDDTVAFLNLYVENFTGSQKMELSDITEALSNLYQKGYRVFIVPRLDPDNPITVQIYKMLDHFKERCIEHISYIYLMNTNPEIYQEELRNLRTIFSNILYGSCED